MCVSRLCVFLMPFLWLLLLSGCFDIFRLVCFALSYFILLLFLRYLCFTGRQNVVDLERRGGEEEFGGVGGRETLI